MTLASAGARFLTIGSTFALTRFLGPDIQGEVNLAFVLVSTVGMASGFGAAQFVAAHRAEGRDTVFHGSVLVLGGGLVACLAAVAGAGEVARIVGIPGMVRYVPGLALSHYLERCTWMPRSLLVRDMRFRTLGLRVAVGEVAFGASSVAFAYGGLGGDALVLGNLIRAAVGLVFMLAVTNLGDHLWPCRLSLATFRRILRFGLPITISQFLRIGATTWDNTLMGARFGSAVVGVYNQAYRLAELPAMALGDPANDVLVPTFARFTDPAARRAAFLRAAALLALLLAPMAAGLGVIAPTLVDVFYPPAYSAVGPFLAALAIVGVGRSLLSLANAFLQVTGRTKSFIFIDAGLVVAVLGSLWILSRWGAVPAACGVGIGFFVSGGLALRALRPEGLAIVAVLRAMSRPAFACIPLIAVVWALRHALSGTSVPAAVRLFLEVCAGGLAYAGGAFFFARPLVGDFMGVGTALIRRRAPTPPPPG